MAGSDFDVVWLPLASVVPAALWHAAGMTGLEVRSLGLAAGLG